MYNLSKGHINLYYFNTIEKEIINSVINKIKLQKSCAEVAFIKINTDSEDERIRLRKAINTELGPFIVFSLDNAVAKLAWEVNALHYIDLNSANLLNGIEVGLRKSLFWESRQVSTLAFKGQKQIDIVNPFDIVFIIASGNYSELHLENAQKLLVTKQLGQIEEKLASLSFLERFGKSLIINLNKIRKIENNSLIFKNNEIIHFPKYSKSFVFLKNKLIWKI